MSHRCETIHCRVIVDDDYIPCCPKHEWLGRIRRRMQFRLAKVARVCQCPIENWRGLERDLWKLLREVENHHGL